MVSPLIDAFGRRIDYVRLSVTDRCDLRCTYCMTEAPAFLPRAELLTWEEMERLAGFLQARGVERLRVTGGEPLVRRGVLEFLKRLGGMGFRELTLTTNGTLLAGAVPALVDAGIRRVNVSCDSLKPDVFRRITRGGDLDRVLAGMAAAQDAGLKVKLNVVALQRDNRAELPDIIAFAHQRGMDVSLIETMPMGEDIDREDQFLPLSRVLDDLRSFWTVTPVADATAGHFGAGPARYYRIAETGGQNGPLLGLITPLSHNFCDTCNRVRITCTGRLYMCLGQDDHVDLRGVLRQGGDLDAALARALALKPRRHDFHIASDLPAPERSHRPARGMYATGG